jgi:hypothetical protein
MKCRIPEIALAILILFALPLVYAQEARASHEEVLPVISNLTISPDTVTDLRLKPLYAATIRMPEAVSSVVVGAPTFFQAEHNEHEPELVIVKPITTQASVSNLLIATKSGQVVSLRLISDGAVNSNTQPVDFVLTYRRQRSFLIGPSDETSPAALAKPESSAYESAYRQQAYVSSPEWTTSVGELEASLGVVTEDGPDTIVAFSVLNNSQHWVELLPPQVELGNPNGKQNQTTGDRSKKKVLADQVAIRDYRFTQRRLAPGARAAGVVRFVRPDFKQFQEHLQLVLATADAVNRPLLLDLPFTAPRAAAGNVPGIDGESHVSNESRHKQ